MLSALYLAAAFLAGLTLVHRFLPGFPTLVRLAGGFVVGIAVVAWVTYLVAWALSGVSEDSVIFGIFASLILCAAIIGLWARDLAPKANWLPGQERLRVGVLLLFVAATIGLGLLFGPYGVVGALVVGFIVAGRWFGLQQLRLTRFEMAVAVLSLLFSFWLMDQRMSGDPLTVSANTWGDTALHTALARSFSWGSNFSTEYPFFGGEPIRYHFGYDFFAGALNEGGMSIQYAFNLPGALGFAAIMVLVYELGKYLFARPWVGVLAVVLLITNSSLAFLEFFDEKSLSDLWDHNRYLSVGPYFVDGEIDQVSIFWTLNVFLTQTHLIIAMGLVLFVTYAIIRLLFPKGAGAGYTGSVFEDKFGTGSGWWDEVVARRPKPSDSRFLALGVLFGISFWLNGVLFTSAMVMFLALFFVSSKRLYVLPYLIPVFVLMMILGSEVSERFYFMALVFALGGMFIFGRSRDALLFIVPAAVIALPQAIWLNGGLGNDGSVQYHPMYLVCESSAASCNATDFRFDELSHYGDFLEYWWLNLGLALPLMALAALLTNGRERRIMLAFMAIFIFGSFVQLSRDLGGHNHKIFNLWEVVMNLFVAFAFVRIWELASTRIKLGNFKLDPALTRTVAAVVLAGAFVVLVFSGIMDFMVIKNDARFTVFDRPEAIQWVGDNTPKRALFLTAYGDLYTTPTLAGRRVFLGYEPWAGSAGYDVAPRQATAVQIYGAPSKDVACGLLLENDIDIVQLGPAERAPGKFMLNESLFENEFEALGQLQFPDGTLTYYDVERSCAGAVSTGSSS